MSTDVKFKAEGCGVVAPFNEDDQAFDLLGAPPASGTARFVQTADDGSVMRHRRALENGGPVAPAELVRKCETCGKYSRPDAMECPSCGGVLGSLEADSAASKVARSRNAANRREADAIEQRSRSRTAYILFGLFFGTLGVHNFYARHYVAGAAQLGTYVAGIALIVVALVSATSELALIAKVLYVILYISVIVNIATQKYDGEGRLLR